MSYFYGLAMSELIGVTEQLAEGGRDYLTWTGRQQGRAHVA
jgi:hypothetical protein